MKFWLKDVLIDGVVGFLAFVGLCTVSIWLVGVMV